jgi:hypothetical protein
MPVLSIVCHQADDAIIASRGATRRTGRVKQGASCLMPVPCWCTSIVCVTSDGSPRPAFVPHRTADDGSRVIAAKRLLRQQVPPPDRGDPPRLRRITRGGRVATAAAHLESVGVSSRIDGWPSRHDLSSNRFNGRSLSNAIGPFSSAVRPFSAAIGPFSSAIHPSGNGIGPISGARGPFSCAVRPFSSGIGPR